MPDISDILSAGSRNDLKILFGMDADETDGKKTQARAECSQDFINIKEIKHGMIITKEGRYLSLFIVHPDNLLGKPDREKFAAMNNFASFLRSAPLKYHLKIINRRYSADEILRDIDEKITGKPTSFQEIGIAYKRNVQQVLTATSVQRIYVFIFEYAYQSAIQRLTDPADIANELMKIRGQIISSLQLCVGRCELPSDKAIGRLYYEYFNPRTYRKIDYRERVTRIFDDTLLLTGKTNDDDVDVPLDNLLAPMNIDFTEKNYYVMDGVYRSHMYIPSNGWPVGEVVPGFLTPLLLSDAGHEVDIFFRKINVASLRQSLKVSKKVAEGLGELTKSNDRRKSLQKTYAAKDYFSDGLEEGDIPYDLALMFTLSADTYEELILKKRYLKSYLDGKGYRVKDMPYAQDIGFAFASMTFQSPKQVISKARKNILASDLTAFYPFNSYSLDNNGGFVIGRNQSDMSVIRVNPFDQTIYNNANMVVLGETGSGKSFTMQTLAIRTNIMGIQNFAIIPEKQHEWLPACRALGGTFIVLGEGSRDHVNVLDIRPSGSIARELLYEISSDMSSYLSEKISDLLTFFKLVMKHMDPEEEQLLNKALVEVYGKYGITSDNDSVYKVYGDKESGLKDMPILGDVYEIAMEIQGLQRVAVNLEAFVNGNAQSFNQRTNVDLDSNYVVGSIELLRKDMMPIGMYILTSIFYSKIKEDPTKRQLIFLDEGSMLISAGVHDSVALMVRDMFKLVRGYGGGVVLGTQDVTDFYSKNSGEFGQAILAASAITITHKLKYSELKALQDTTNINNQVVNLISSFKQRGEGMLIHNNSSVPIQVIASEHEMKLINSDPEIARQILREKMKSQAANKE